jgi:hypothetical protein
MCFCSKSAHQLQFNAAEAECQANHGHLVTIHDADTQSFVYNTFRHDLPNFQGVIWIGLTDQQYEGAHTWTDGEFNPFTAKVANKRLLGRPPKSIFGTK